MKKKLTSFRPDDEYDLEDSFIDDNRAVLEDSFDEREYMDTIGKIRKYKIIYHS